MPFDRYLDSQDGELDNGHSYESNVDPFFQWPQFLQHSLPVLAPGGGAELLPPTSIASPWITDNINGFSCQNSIFYAPPSSNFTSSSLSHALHLPPALDVHPKKIAPDPLIPQRVQTALSPYSSSGFDLLPLLARVVNRPHPNIFLGPVDLSCSFVVVDIRRYDSPVVYCSPTFCRLTGYEEHEVVGRNCRFLQSPDGTIQRGQQRRDAPEPVAHLRKSLIANKECQTHIINYRKGGAAFANLLTVIPISGGASNLPHEADDFVYHIGFQVDLKEQPNAIVQRLPSGSYFVDYTSSSIPPVIAPSLRDRRSHVMSIPPISNVLRTLLTDPRFLRSIPISAFTTVASSPAPDNIDVHDANKILNLVLLEYLPDFIHVVSLKGSFLYVAPSVRNVLGYEPEELVGKSISEFCHPADLVPLMRELKESSLTSVPVHPPPSTVGTPKTVDILFRARSKTDGYLWVECRGRLHAEPGKGRKAIILSGRARRMPQLKWESVARAGGLILPSVFGRKEAVEDARKDSKPAQQEVWGMLTKRGMVLSVGDGIQDILGWEVDEFIGQGIGSLVSGNNDSGHGLAEVLAGACKRSNGEPSTILVSLQHKDGHCVKVHLVLYSSLNQISSASPSCPLVFQIKLACLPPSTRIRPLVHPLSSNIFEELDISRGTSWQYELQQLKFANQRLAQEIDELEQRPLTPPTYLHGFQRRCRPGIQDLTTSAPTGLKRSWDSMIGSRSNE